MAQQYNVKPAIAQALRVLRDEKGMSRAEVAAKAGTSETNVFRWENGERTPDANNLYALANTYEVDPGSFFPSKRVIEQALNSTKENDGNSNKDKKKS